MGDGRRKPNGWRHEMTINVGRKRPGWMLGLGLMGLLSVVTVAYRPPLTLTEQSMTGQSMTQQALVALMEREQAPVILDVRTAQEYLAGHIPGAIHIDYRELPGQLEEIRALGRESIVVYCERGIRAGIALEVLQKAGFEQILSLEGDLVEWRKHQLPIIPASRI